MLKVLFFALADNASNFYRLVQPAKKLDEQKLCTVGVATSQDFAEARAKAAQISDVIVFYSATSPRLADGFDKLHKMGKKIVMDFNDDIFHLSPYSPHYAVYGTEEAIIFDEDGLAVKLWEAGVNIDLEKNRKFMAEQLEVIKAVELITVTTPYLAKVYEEYNRTAVLPDMVDLNVWKPLRVSYPESHFRLGWRGGHSHYEDLISVKSEIGKIMQRFPHVKLVMSGWNPGAFSGELPKSRVESHPFVGYAAWPYHAMSLGINAAFYPWKTIEFNKGKNNLAWIEWSAAGVPGVYPALDPYTDHVRHGETGLLALSNEGFYENVSQLIKDVRLRTRIGWEARREVEKNWDINRHIGRWKETYEWLYTESLDRKAASGDFASASI